MDFEVEIKKQQNYKRSFESHQIIPATIVSAAL